MKRRTAKRLCVRVSFCALMAIAILSVVMKPPKMTPIEDTVCTDAPRRAELFRTLKKDRHKWMRLACPPQDWLLDLRRASSLSRERKFFLDVGCNKGYTSAKWFNLWATGLNMSAAALWERHYKKEFMAKRNAFGCGVCGDCHDVSPSYPEYPGDMTVFCIEPSLANFQDLISVRSTFFPNITSTGKSVWQLLHMAVSNTSGYGYFAGSCKHEVCSLSTSNSYALSDLVPIVGLDDLCASLHINEIEIAKIDTEGYDALAVQGFQKMLTSKKVRVLTFEYHGIGEWKKNGLYSLKETVVSLERAGYVCFLDGTVMFQLTGCWTDVYEIREWSNVVCVQKTDRDMLNVLTNASHPDYIESKLRSSP